jgi:hypothetical protein
MKIKVVYGYHSKTKILEVDNKFKQILTAWDENRMSLWQELVDELHQIVKSAVERSSRYVVYEADSNRLMYF